MILHQSKKPKLGLGRKFRKSRFAADELSEKELIGELTEAYFVMEVCIDFNDCDGTRATKVRKSLNNIGESFVNNALRNVTENFKKQIKTILR